MKHRFFITDVFADRRYSGNQLATFMESADISDAEMQQIAREMNFSETTFIHSDRAREGGFDVRIFTPEEELDFAGHPTLGSAYIIREHLLQRSVDRVTLNLRVGQVPVDFTAKNEVLWMHQVAPRFGEKLDPARLASVVGLQEEELDPRFPIEQVSTGLPFIIMPLRSLAALRRIALRRDEYLDLIKGTWAKTILAFSPEGYEAGQSISVRVFPVSFGIPEDPATGSGNGCLAAYLLRNRYFRSDVLDVQVGQGYEIGRPSRLYLRGRDDAGRIHVSVGGKVIPVAEGWWG